MGIYIFWFICYFYLNMNKMGLLWVFLSGEEMGNWFRHIFVNKSESPNWLHVQTLSSLNMEQIIQWEISFSTIVLPKSSRYRIFRTFLMTPDVLLHVFFFWCLCFFGVSALSLPHTPSAIRSTLHVCIDIRLAEELVAHRIHPHKWHVFWMAILWLNKAVPELSTRFR